MLRDRRVTSALIGVRTLDQLDENIEALDGLELSPAELAEIDQHATDGDVDI